jgi:hypothetical protein
VSPLCFTGHPSFFTSEASLLFFRITGQALLELAAGASVEAGLLVSCGLGLVPRQLSGIGHILALLLTVGAAGVCTVEVTGVCTSPVGLESVAPITVYIGT